MSSPRLTRRHHATSGITIRHGGKDTHMDCDSRTTIKALHEHVHEQFKLAIVRQRLLYFHGGTKELLIKTFIYIYLSNN